MTEYADLQLHPTVSLPVQADPNAFAWLRENPADERDEHFRRLLLDVDGILFPFLRAFAHGLGVDWSEAECKTWRVYPTEHTAEEEAAALLYGHSEEGIRKFGLYEGAKEQLQRLKDHGIEVIICTRRSEESGVWTKKVFEEWGLVFDDFLAGPKLNKPQIARERNAHTLVDDKPATMEKALEEGLDVYSLVWPYNEDLSHPNLVFASSWPDLADKLLAGAQFALNRLARAVSPQVKACECRYWR